jgi:small subunit ribosomal protein S20
VANHPQALKRHRQSIKRRTRNRHYKTLVKNTVKGLRAAINEGKDSETIEGLLRSASSLVHRVGQKGIIKPNTANRTVARLAKAVTRGPVEAHKPKSKAAKKK